MIIKLTFFLLYLHIFYQNTKLKFCIYAGAFISTVFYIGIGITLFIRITPRHGMSLLEIILTTYFRKINRLALPASAVGLGIDLYILILPIEGVMQLHMPIRRKLGVCIIFLTGILFVFVFMPKIYFLELTIGTGPVSRLHWIFIIESFTTAWKTINYGTHLSSLLQREYFKIFQPVLNW